jgi:GDP-L-fucose synthase
MADAAAAYKAYNLAGKRVWVAGHGGLVGSALVRRLASESCELVTAPRDTLDLRRQQDVENWLAEARPQAIFLAAAKVGGIHANDSQPAEFLYDNMMIEANIVHGAWRTGVEKLVFLGSTCIYPKFAPQPMAEDDLMTGPLEPTNQAYAMAKISGIYYIEAHREQYGRHWISAMPTNLYGPKDNFDLETSHVLPAFIRRFHEAKESGASTVTVWGTGAPRREFLHVDDLAQACLMLLNNYDSPETINVGWGEDLPIKELAETVADVVGFTGEIEWDTSKPDGMPRKLLDTNRINALGWKPAITLRDGLTTTYDWYVQNAG